MAVQIQKPESGKQQEGSGFAVQGSASVPSRIPQHPSRITRRGVALVEASIVMSLLLLLIFGVLEYGYFVFVKHTLKSAAAAGVRAGIVLGGDNTAIGSAVTAAMNSTGISGSNYNQTISVNGVSGGDVGTAARGDLVTVTVTCPNWGNVGIRPMALIPATTSISAQATMVKE